MMMRRQLMALMTAVVMSIVATDSVSADPIVQYGLFGNTGDEASVTPTFEAAGISGLSLVRGGGLTPTVAANAFSASGWDDLAADDYFELGFTITDPLLFIEVDSLILATRSSNTGPGLLNVLVSVDGGALSVLTTRTQTGTAFNNDIVSIGQTVFSSLVIRITAANTTSANGGTIGSGGTLRLGEQLANGDFSPVTFTGTFQVVPEPSSLLLAGLGGIGLIGAARLRRRPARSR